ncbi:hypothetical protein BH11CYA1_BH11CYA1_50690 [soil metagenome]
MTNEKRTEGWLSRYVDRVETDPRNTPEETAQFKADREALLGTTKEWAEMQLDRSIELNIVQWLPDGSRGHGSALSAPGDPDYKELCKLHNLQKPGDASTIFKRLIDGVWVIVDDLE